MSSATRHLLPRLAQWTFGSAAQLQGGARGLAVLACSSHAMQGGVPTHASSSGNSSSMQSATARQPMPCGALSSVSVPFSAAVGLTSVRGMACSAGLGRAPPKRVVIEYDPEDVEAYIAVADAIEAAFTGVVVEGNEEAEGRPGSFEVRTEDGTQPVFSRLTVGKQQPLPSPDDIVAAIIASGRVRGTTYDGTEGPACT